MPLRYVNLPTGILRLQGTDRALKEVRLVEVAGPEEAPEALSRCARELTEYFAGTRREFSVSAAPEGTVFQMAVWEALKTIPYGTTLTYAQVAKRVGKPGAARAVGNAVGANPCLILIPCHRVVAAGGIGGFSGGVENKRQLLTLEGITDFG